MSRLWGANTLAVASLARPHEANAKEPASQWCWLWCARSDVGPVAEHPPNSTNSLLNPTLVCGHALSSLVLVDRRAAVAVPRSCFRPVEMST